MHNIEVFLLGRSRFAAALDLMNHFHELVVKGEQSPLLLVTEHDAVVTMGNRKLHADLKFSVHADAENSFQLRQIPYFEIDRGGSATAHEPGQIVVYPIVPIEWFGASVRSYITALEHSVIQSCMQFGICAAVKREFPGVWVGEKKIAAVGVRVKNHVTKHGLAFNVTNDLSAFDQIIPCGIRGKSVTSLFAELQKPEPFLSGSKLAQPNQLSQSQLFQSVQNSLLQNLEKCFSEIVKTQKIRFVFRSGAELLQNHSELRTSEQSSTAL